VRAGGTAYRPRVTSRSRTATALAALATLSAPFVAGALAAARPAAERALWQTLAVQVAWCGLAVGFAMLAGGALRERLGLARGKASAAGVALAAAGTLALSGALQFTANALALTPGSTLERLESVARAAAPSQPWLVLLAFGVAPGIGEELLFRGAIQRSLARALGAAGIPLAALAFGLLHLDPVHSPAAFVLGLYLGAVAWRADATWPAMACHVANNCAAALPSVAPAIALPQPESWPEAAVWLAAGASALAAFARLSGPRTGASARASG
jgi:membrane protease YdiL (CAAX protease family)